MSARGKFITLEGADNAGKSTQASLLADFLREQTIEVLQTREPGGTESSESIRELVLNLDGLDGVSETLLMFAARREHILRKIEPALAAGRWVICDRFTDSTIAYQGGGRGVSRDFINMLAHYVQGETVAELTFYLQSPPAIATNPLFAAEKFERENEVFYRRVTAMYDQLAQQQPQRIQCIPTYDKKRQRTREEMAADIHAIVRATLL